jgi:hypothetical protein
MGRFVVPGSTFRPVGVFALALGSGLEDVLGLGLLDFGLFLGRRAAPGDPEQEQAADCDDAEASDLGANRRHR